MAQDGKREYATLLTEDRVLAAIHTAIKREDGAVGDEEKHAAGTKDYWQNIAKPIYMEIFETRKWPASCSFDGFYKLGDTPGISYDGLGLRLNINTPENKFKGYALPILDLYFGRGGD